MQGAESAVLKRLMNALLPVRTVCLAAATGVDRVAVLTDEIEVMPDLPLGDVLAEELSIDVPYGALILLCDEDTIAPPMDLGELSYDLGLAVGKTLLTVLRSGAFPIERENEALYIMACGYHALARTSGMRTLGLVPERFARGLVAPLGAYWSGARMPQTERSTLFIGDDCLARPALRAYLRTLEPGFSAPEPGRIPSGLLAFDDGTCSLESWMAKVSRAVESVMAPAPV